MHMEYFDNACDFEEFQIGFYPGDVITNIDYKSLETYRATSQQQSTPICLQDLQDL